MVHKFTKHDTLIAINKHGTEVYIRGDLLGDCLERGMIVVAQILQDGTREEFMEPITHVPVARKLFSAGWNGPEPVEPIEKPKVEEVKVYNCATCGFEAKSGTGLSAHERAAHDAS